MTDTGVGLEPETPVNPYSLIDAVNRSGHAVQTAWLITLALMAYLALTVAGVTHRDLLLDSEVTLPILGVKIALVPFFLAVPVVVVLLHLGLLLRLALLSRQVNEFNAALQMLEPSDARTHPLRLAVENTLFVQAAAGPERSRVVSALIYLVAALSVVLLPLGLLLYVQLAFLPYHDALVTNAHRVALIADVLLLALAGVLVLEAETSVFRAVGSASAYRPLTLAAGLAVLIGAVAVSMLVATVPGETAGRVAATAATATASASQQGPDGVMAVAPGAVREDRVLFGMFPRNLSLADQDLVAGRTAIGGERSLNLRSRDLRFARFDRSNLRQADLTGADLEGASLTGADLSAAWLSCAGPDRAPPSEDRPAVHCTRAPGADFRAARLSQARMAGIDLSGSRLDGARLDAADLAGANLSGASLAGVRAERANLAGAALPGAGLRLAALQGADLSAARMQRADLTGALLQGASLMRAGLEGALLRGAGLEGASLQQTRLTGADATAARLAGADLSGAIIWRTLPPGADGATFADAAEIALRPPGDAETSAVRAMLARFEPGALKTRLSEGLGAALEAGDASWTGSPEAQSWQDLARASEATRQADGAKKTLADYLGKLACAPRWADGAVASGLVRRALAPGFRGDVVALYDRLRAADCATAAGAVSPRLMRELASVAEAARTP